MRALKLSLGLAMLALSGALLLRVWPHAPLSSYAPSSTAVFDANGRLLRLTLASDQQYRVWTPLEQISPEFIEALLLHEDQYFYAHPGVNLVALTRAAFRTVSGPPRQGASTLTMQLARRIYGLNSHSVGGKLRQIAAALWLELRYSKREILEAHVNLMPYSRNIQGVSAASLIYFGKRPAQLTLGESLALVLIPQSPRARDPIAGEPASLFAARQRLMDRWLQAHPDAAAMAGLAREPMNYSGPSALPFEAPHAVNALLAEAESTEIHATLDLKLQRLFEKRIAQYIASQRRVGVNNAAAMLIDYRSMEVKALVGSADFFDDKIAGQVNGAAAKRSPGSALKPFIYALAFDQGLIHPLSVLKDAPTSFGPYSPENFDGAFVGPITAHDALIRSRNVPAVALTARLSEPSFYDFLKAAGISQMATEQHYGLALALGGGEVSMEELVNLYAMLANGGVLEAVRHRADQPRNPTLRLLSEEASFMTLDILRDNPRPDAASASYSAASPVAWKTGTSWGFRDAWSVGVYGPYVLAVWVGNFDGSSNPAFVGAQVAAPLFFQLIDAVQAAQPGLSTPIRRSPSNLAKIDVCAASGDLPNVDCPQTVKTWFIPGKSPIKVSTVHRKLSIDRRSGLQACVDTPKKFVREEVFEFWPSDILQLYAQAGMPRKQPPANECAKASSQANAKPKITSPLSGAAYQLRAATFGTESLALSAAADADVRTLYWFVDGSFVGTAKPSGILAWTPTQAGKFTVSAVDDRGESDSRQLRIAVVP